MNKDIPMMQPVKKYKQATHQDGVDLCQKIFALSQEHGFYPALTGGLLYKRGSRKDIDIVLFRNRQELESFSASDFGLSLELVGVKIISTHGFVTKCEWNGFSVDILNPEAVEYGTYGQGQ